MYFSSTELIHTLQDQASVADRLHQRYSRQEESKNRRGPIVAMSSSPSYLPQPYPTPTLGQ